MEKALNKIKENQRYFWAFLALISVFLINNAFPAEKITSESCAEGKCKTAIENPSLSNEKGAFYANDVFQSKPNEYYRLIFQVRSNQKTSLTSFITNALDQNKEIGFFDIEKTNVNITKEITFKSDNVYSDLLFKKTAATDGADVFIDQINLFKLNITNDQEITSLAPTIIGSADTTIEDQAQNNSGDSFEQLKEPKLLFGQIFIPKMNYITGISLDIDIVKQSNNGGKKYVLELREVDMESDAPDIKSNPIASLGFSVDDMEKYRQENGKFLFPLSAKLEPDKSYFIGINNDKVEVDKFNYLILKGTKNKDSYRNGSLAIKYQKLSYLTVGSLYFKTYGFELKKYNGVPILPGSIIGDFGKGKNQFFYKSLPNAYELINLDFKTDDIYFDNDKKVLAGEIKDGQDSFFTYKLETAYPFSSFSISGNQADPTWNRIKLFYSFDNENWQEVPYSSKFNDNNEYQNFYLESQEKNKDKHEIYVKIEPTKDKYPNKNKFGFKDFEFKADLIVPNK